MRSSEHEADAKGHRIACKSIYPPSPNPIIYECEYLYPLPFSIEHTISGKKCDIDTYLSYVPSKCVHFCLYQ